jgi:hypothetical protein
MALALVVQIIAFAGMAIVALRAARRGAELAEQVKQQVQPSILFAGEIRESLRTHLETISNEGKQIAEVVTNRSQILHAMIEDTARRAERVRLRLLGDFETVEGEKPGRRGIYREIAEPIRTASHVMRGLKIALWIMRRVA